MTTPLTQRERFIQIFGALIFMSPAFNLLLEFNHVLGPNGKWTWPVILTLFKAVTKTAWVLNVCSVIIGSMMMRGKRTSWIPVLVLLGIYIAFNIINFRKDIAHGWFLPTLNTLTNISLFALIYSQEFHQIAQQAGLDLIRRMKLNPSYSATMHFQGHGNWAKLLLVTPTHISMRAITPPPANIQSKVIEIALNKNLVLHARYRDHHLKNGHQVYYFEFIFMSAEKKELLQNWLIQKKFSRPRPPVQAVKAA